MREFLRARVKLTGRVRARVRARVRVRVGVRVSPGPWWLELLVSGLPPSSG